MRRRPLPLPPAPALLHNAFVPRYMSEAQYETLVQTLGGDHASVVRSAAGKAGMVFSGDPSHGTALVMKAVAGQLGVLQTFRIVRRALIGKNDLALKSLLAAFGIPSSVFNIPIARWAYTARVARTLSDPDICSRLQQLALYMREWLARKAGVASVLPEGLGGGAVTQEEGDDDEDEVLSDDGSGDDDVDDDGVETTSKQKQKYLNKLAVCEGRWLRRGRGVIVPGEGEGGVGRR